MLIARVIGELISTHKHPSHAGRKALIVQPLDLDGSGRGDAVIAFFDAESLVKDGKPYKNTCTWYMRLKDGKIVEWQDFTIATERA